MPPRHMPGNCLLAVTNYGVLGVVVTRLTFGTQVYYSLTEGRNAEVPYMMNATSSGFTMHLLARSRFERDVISTWFAGYIERAANGTLGIMVAWLPAADGFARTGIPRSPVLFGDRVGAITYTMAVDFIGTRKLDEAENVTVSRFQMPREGVAESQYFFPTGIQRGGVPAPDDQLYDDVPQPPRPLRPGVPF